MRAIAPAVVALLGIVSACGQSDSAGDEVVFVTGSSAGTECVWEDQTAKNSEDPAIDVYAGTLMCTSEMSDPRVSGTEQLQMKEPFFYTHMSGIPETARFEATTTLVTDGGVWRGEGFGSDLWDADGGGLKTTYFAEYVGEGGYDGLRYRVWGSQHPDSDGYLLVGYIEPVG